MHIQSSATNCGVAQSIVGANETATAALPNGMGVLIEGPFSDVMGSVISGNLTAGIVNRGAAANNTEIRGNKIGHQP